MTTLAILTQKQVAIELRNLEVTKNRFSTRNTQSLNSTNCGEHGIYFDQQICLENGYHRAIPPDHTKATVNISIYKIHVNEVDDNKRILTFTL